MCPSNNHTEAKLVFLLASGPALHLEAAVTVEVLLAGVIVPPSWITGEKTTTVAALEATTLERGWR